VEGFQIDPKTGKHVGGKSVVRGKTIQWQKTPRNQDTEHMKKVQPGDIVWWNGHIGFALKYDAAAGILHTIEGNASARVKHNKHNMRKPHRQIAAIIRLPNFDGTPPSCT